jgi:hypothetical protein
VLHKIIPRAARKNACHPYRGDIQGSSFNTEKPMTRMTLSEDIFQMNRRGGYILAFSRSVAAEIPDLSWNEYRNALVMNGTFCGYADSVVRKAFGR